MAPFELKLAETPDTPRAAGAETPALLIGELYEQHYPMIRALCQLLLKDPVDAEDAAQQTFLSAFGSMIDGTVPRSPAPWLATIARRECWTRSAQRRRRPLTLDETNAPVSAADNLSKTQFATRIWRRSGTRSTACRASSAAHS